MDFILCCEGTYGCLQANSTLGQEQLKAWVVTESLCAKENKVQCLDVPDVALGIQ